MSISTIGERFLALFIAVCKQLYMSRNSVSKPLRRLRNSANSPPSNFSGDHPMGFTVAILFALMLLPGISGFVNGIRRKDDELFDNALRRLAWGGVGATILTALLIWMGRYVNFLWFENLGFEDVYLRQIWTKFGAFMGFGLFGAATFFFFIQFPFRWMPNLSDEGSMERFGTADKGNVERSKELVAKCLHRARLLVRDYKVLAVVVIATVFVIWGVNGVGYWEEILVSYNAAEFGQADPVFNKDIGFYMFKLPWLKTVASALFWTFTLGFLAGLSMMAFLNNHAINPGDSPVPHNVRRYDKIHHLKWFSLDDEDSNHSKGSYISRNVRTILLLALLPVAAFLYRASFWKYELLYSESGRVFGASWFDLEFWLPMYYVCLLLIALTGVIILLLRFRPQVFTKRRLKWGAIGTVVAFVATIVIGAVMNTQKNSNEIELEMPYIKHNIAATRSAFGLNKVEVRDYNPRNDLTLEDIMRSPETLENIRIWDWRAARKTYEQEQEIRPYYEFPDLDVDRYTLNGKYRQVLLATRELDVDRLPNSDSWNNRHLVYTHGYGVVMNQVNEFDSEGKPIFHISGIHSESDIEGLEITRPEIYFGHLTNQHVYVNSTLEEFDYGTQDGKNATTRYKGRGGVPLGGFFRKLAFAWEFDGFKVLFSGALKSDSRVMWRRKVRDRVSEIAPFLTLDRDGYKVIRDDGSLAYILDAYTTSNRYPLLPTLRVEGLGTG